MVLEQAVAEGFVGNLDECERCLDEFFRSGCVPDDLAGFSTSAMAHTWTGYVLQHRGCVKEAVEFVARAEEIAVAANG
jgi:hypothetical protein